MSCKVAIYARESTDKQDINTLVGMCEAEAKKLGFTHYKVYKDVGTGYSNEREEYIKLLENIKIGKIKTIILYEQSRMTRDELEHQILYKLFRENDVKLYVMNRGWIDPNDENDSFISGLLNLLEAKEGRTTAKRVRDRMMHIKDEGNWTGGPTPLGYKLVDKKLIIVPEEAEKVKEIFRLFISGEKRTSIAKLFGYESKKIFRLLKNPIYIGKLKKNQIVIKNKKAIENKKFEIVDGIHEGIVDIGTFQIVQEMLKGIKREVSEITTLHDLLYCRCGSKIYKHGKYYYSCKNPSCRSVAIKRNEIIETVLTSLEEVIDDLGEVEEIEDDSLVNKIQIYGKELKKLNIKKEKIFNKYLEDQISEDLFNKNNKEVSDQIENVNLQINNLKEMQNNKLKAQETRENIKVYYNKIKNTKDEKKINRLLKVIISKIEFVNDYRFYIHLKF
ncbi:MAG: recombinase family protein [Cetobacterium sp.]